MDDQEFVTLVAERAHVDTDAARGQISAVFTTLAERISGSEARQLADVLPESARDPLRAGDEPAHGWSPDEFVGRVAERLHADPATAQRAAHAVLATARDAEPGEFEDVMRQLPHEYAPLVARLPRRPVPPME